MAGRELNQPVENYAPEGYPVSRYEVALKAWEDRIGSAVVRAKNWRLCALGMIILCLVLSAGIIYQSSKAQVTPFVVMLGTDGAPVAVERAVSTNYVPQDREIKYFLKEWVKKMRSVPLDPVLAKESWTNAFNMLRGSGLNKMRDLMRQENPTLKLGKQTIQVEVQVVVPMSASTYQVRWTESEFAKEGKLIESRKMTGLFTVEIIPPKDEKEILVNPLGLYIKDLSWSRETR